MEYRTRENKTVTFIVALVFVVIVAALVAVAMLSGASAKEPTDEYSWITSDAAAVDGMLDGTYYSGEKNAAAVLSYKIAEEITVDGSGAGDFKIENSGKNSCLMKVTITVDGEVVYESGYIKPNQHINADKLDTVPEAGTYTAEAVFEGYDPSTEASIGKTRTSLTITVTE